MRDGQAVNDKTSGGTVPHRNQPERSADLGVIEQRLFSNESNLKQLAEDTNRQIRDLATNTTQQINNLASSMQSQTSGLAADIGKLDSSLQERGKIPWPALGVMLTFLTVIGGLVYWPINNGQTRIENALMRMVETTPSNKEIAIAALRRDDWQRQVEDRFKKVEADADGLQKDIVPRGEHVEKWRGADIRFADQQRQLDSLKSDFSGLYSPRDALTSMQQRLQDLERRLLQAASAPRS